MKCRILLEKYQVKLNGRLKKSTSCGDEKENGTKANKKSQLSSTVTGGIRAHSQSRLEAKDFGLFDKR